MLSLRHLRALSLRPLLVVLGLNLHLYGCGSENQPKASMPHSELGGASTSDAGRGGRSSDATTRAAIGGTTAVISGRVSVGGNAQNSGSGTTTVVSSGIGSSAANTLALGGVGSGGGATGALNTRGNSAGAFALGGSSVGGAPRGGASNTPTGAKASGGSASATSSSSAIGGAGVASGVEELPTRAEVLEVMRRANGYFVTRWPDPTKDIVTDKARPSNLWTRAIYYEGLMGLYSVETDAAKKSTYYDSAVTWASAPAHPYGMTYTAASSMTDNADNQACGQTYIELYRVDPQPERIAVIKANIDSMISKGTTDVWTWIDAIQMAMPVFAKLGKTLGDTKYFDAMWSLYAYSRNTRGGGLFNTAEGLWWRDFHFSPGGTKQVMTSTLHDSMPASTVDAYIVAPNGKNLYWSRGNGWVMAALVRVLDELPDTDTHRGQYIADFKAMAEALLPIQRSDGFWVESLTDPAHCATIGIAGQDGPETSGTALFAYGLAWGIRNGHLATTTYAPALANAWRGLTTIALQSNGLLGYVQNTGDRPCTGPSPLAATTSANFDDYGVGCFLLAGTEMYRLASE